MPEEIDVALADLQHMRNDADYLLSTKDRTDLLDPKGGLVLILKIELNRTVFCVKTHNGKGF